MIGRLYTVAIGGQAQSGVKTLMEIAGAADSVSLLERAYIGQSSFDTSENVAMKIEDIATTGTGTATTPNPMQEGDAAFGGTVETNASAEPTYSGTVYHEIGFNVLSGSLWTPANDDEVIAISPSQLIGIMLDVAPSASMNFHYGCTLREIGG